MMNLDAESETTGLPGLRTWRAVYIFIVVIFCIWVGLLAALARSFQ
jgi:hypothetical protein